MILNFVLIAIIIALITSQELVNGSYLEQQCKTRQEVPLRVDFDSVSLYPYFNFQPKWIRTHKHFWASEHFDFESRYLKRFSTSSSTTLNPRFRFRRKGGDREDEVTRKPANVFLLPFSHTDPGWKLTFEEYYHAHTKGILSNAVSKLTEFTNMTFAWSEIAFLSKWWDGATSDKKEGMRKLVESGRLEILSGGWVMPDEASPSLFGLTAQLIEGHQWIQENLNLNFTPSSAWAIDPFGHSSTMPYILKKAGIDGMMIQRLHYSWKHWLAEHQSSDFVWYPNWSSNPEDAIICHSAHYDLYPTKHSCGPFPSACMAFDFRSIPEKKEEHHSFVKAMDENTLPTAAQTLTEQYKRTASLTKHNQVITGLGGDFRFDEALEWDQQYGNYSKLFQYINSHSKEYQTLVKFGTLTEYFKAVRESKENLPTFKGDFFPYSDVIFAYAPAYWSGFGSTRPYWKKLSREAEDELLKAEIIFSFAYNFLSQKNHSSAEVLSANYDNLVFARRAISLFQHHDGITGTSPRKTMLDYAKTLTQAWKFSKQIQRICIEFIWKSEFLLTRTPFLQSIEVKQSSTSLVESRTVKLIRSQAIVKKLILYNSLSWKTTRLVRVTVEDPKVLVTDMNGVVVLVQVNPKFEKGVFSPNKALYELVFVAELPALSVISYEIRRDDGLKVSSQVGIVPATVSCKLLCDSMPNVIVLENDLIRAQLDSETGLVTQLEDKRGNRAKISVSLGRYDAGAGSGAYLLRPFTNTEHPVINASKSALYLIEGPVASEVVLITNTMKFTTWLIHKGSDEDMLSSIYMSNEFKGDPREFGEYFMRIQTDLDNLNKNQVEERNRKTRMSGTGKRYENKLEEPLVPVFFTDTNGLAVQKRTTVRKLPYEANTYPMTSLAYLQDVNSGQRVSLAVDRSHGVTSMEKGRLEVIFDRNLRYDDARGMDEAVMDSETAISNYAVRLESVPTSAWQPSLALQRLVKTLNSQLTMFTYDALSKEANQGISLFSGEFPAGVHLLNFRTISKSPSEGIRSLPSKTVLLILQNMGHFDSPPRNCISRRNSGGGGRNEDNEGDRSPGRGNETVNNATSTRTSPAFSSTSPSNLKLKASLKLRHVLQEANLVGTRKLSRVFQDTKYVTVGKPFELRSFLVNFNFN